MSDMRINEIVIKNFKSLYDVSFKPGKLNNPLVLDGLDLANDDVKLFTTDRNKYGHVEVRRVQISNELLDMNQPLSRLWINGLLGGVPELL